MAHVQIIDPASLKYDSSTVAPEKVISGNPAQQLANVFTNSKGNFFCGVWRSDTGKWDIEYSEDEFCYLTAGKIVLTDTNGSAKTIRAGEAFVIPSGFKGTWETLEACEKFYAIYEE